MNKILVVAGSLKWFREQNYELIGAWGNNPWVVWIGPHNFPEKLLGLHEPYVLERMTGLELFRNNEYSLILRTRRPRYLTVPEAKELISVWRRTERTSEK